MLYDSRVFHSHISKQVNLPGQVQVIQRNAESIDVLLGKVSSIQAKIDIRAIPEVPLGSGTKEDDTLNRWMGSQHRYDPIPGLLFYSVSDWLRVHTALSQDIP